MNNNPQPWATDDNKLKWMTFFEAAIHLRTHSEIAHECHVSSREYVKKWLRGERVPSQSAQLYIEQMAHSLSLKHLLVDIKYAKSGANAEQRAAARARKVAEKKTKRQIATLEKAVTSRKKKYAEPMSKSLRGPKAFRNAPQAAPAPLEEVPPQTVRRAVTAEGLAQLAQQPIVLAPKEPRLTMRDMFELAMTALPVREHQELFIATTEKFIAFAKHHRMSLTDVLDLLKTA